MPFQDRICNCCNKAFQPSSRHLMCPKCRAKKRPRKFCSNCNKEIQNTSKYCIGCHNKLTPRKNKNKGGTYHKRGYVMIRIPQHPRSKRNSGYIFEHIIVMEQILGRYLTPEEHIHHKNGIKDDNRPENLELWTYNHPNGTRVSDLINWAKDFLLKYEPQVLK